MVAPTEAGSSHTNWALIFDARQGDGAATALDCLVRRYWPAVYAYIRQTGRDVDEASDLTQGFVCDVILSRNLFHHADPKRGRFRSLLLSALRNYLHERHRHDMAGKRSPAVRPIQFDETELAATDGHAGMTPEQAFAAEWNATMIRNVLERVREDCMQAGLEAHWAIFEARVVRPMLFNEPRVPYSRLVERLNLNDSGQAANMMITVKRRFVLALVEEVGLTVADPMEIAEEMRALMRDMERHT